MASTSTSFAVASLETLDGGDGVPLVSQLKVFDTESSFVAPLVGEALFFIIALTLSLCGIFAFTATDVFLGFLGGDTFLELNDLSVLEGLANRCGFG